MLCVSECPSYSYEINGIDFYAMVQKLGEIRVPVLACNMKQKLPAHVRTFCLGFLSEEHLALLVLSIEEPLQLNLTRCAGCRNGFIVDVIKDRLRRVALKTGVGEAEKIRLVDDAAELQYRDITYNRRDFFKAFRSLTSERAQNFLFDDALDQKRQSYTAKTLPLLREVMNRMLRKLPQEDGAKLLGGFYYDLRVDETCDLCSACVGVCPTGALRVDRSNPEKKLFFNSSLCNGCGICASFCDKSAVQLRTGFPCDENTGPFEFSHCLVTGENVPKTAI
jgi:ferredoxin